VLAHSRVHVGSPLMADVRFWRWRWGFYEDVEGGEVLCEWCVSGKDEGDNGVKCGVVMMKLMEMVAMGVEIGEDEEDDGGSCG